jgi:hypothetical protein
MDLATAYFIWLNDNLPIQWNQLYNPDPHILGFEWGSAKFYVNHIF